LIWDSETNDWFYEYEGDDTDHGIFLIGPEYGTKGSPTYNANNKLVKGTGGHHIVDSNITDDGTSVTVSTSLTASAFSGDGSALTNIPSNLGNGAGSNSIITQNITSNDGVSQAIFGIAIGDSAQVINASSADSIAIGRDSAVNNAPDSVAIGYAPHAYNTNTIAIGRAPEASGQYSIALGDGPSAGGEDSIVIGRDSAADFNGAVVLGANAFAQAVQAIAIGKDSSADGDESIAIGKGASASGTNSITLGDGPSAGGTDSIVIGRDGAADFTEAIAIGRGTTAQANNTIGIGAGLGLTSANEINIGDTFKYDGSSDITLDGNVEATGQIYSPTFAGTIASSTSSIDFDNGNFATLNASSATFLANPTNLQSGTTYTIIITNGANISGYGTSWLFAGGTEPTLSANTDILTCVSDGTNLYATALADFS